MEFKDRLKELRKKAGLTQRELAEKSGVSYSYITKLENGFQSNPTYEMLEAIGTVLNAPIGAIYDFSGLDGIKSAQTFTSAEQALIKKYRNLDDHGKAVVGLVLDEEHARILSYEDEEKAEKEYYIKYCDLPASAGTGVVLSDESYQKLKVPRTPTTLLADFAVRVSGNSMEPKYYDGDILLIEEMPDIEIGEIGLFVLNGAGYVKQKGEAGLLSLNENYNCIEVKEYDECKCVGKVIGKL